MTLPKEFKNWTEFAAFCTDKYPNSKQIIIRKAPNTDTTYSITNIKAKAFDEINKRKVNIETVLELRNILHRNTTVQQNIREAIDLLFFLDADVVLSDVDFLQKSVSSFEKNDLDVATIDVVPLGDNIFDKISHKLYNIYARFLGRVLPHAPGFCILIKRRLHNQINGFNIDIRFCEDHDYVRRAGKFGKFGFMDGVSIGVSTRRMAEDGRLIIAIKYFLAELHLVFIGPIYGDKFNYKFEHKKDVYGKRDNDK